MGRPSFRGPQRNFPLALDEEERAHLDDLAERTGLTKSDVLRNLLMSSDLRNLLAENIQLKAEIEKLKEVGVQSTPNKWRSIGARYAERSKEWTQ